MIQMSRFDDWHSQCNYNVTTINYDDLYMNYHDDFE